MKWPKKHSCEEEIRLSEIWVKFSLILFYHIINFFWTFFKVQIQTPVKSKPQKPQNQTHSVHLICGFWHKWTTYRQKLKKISNKLTFGFWELVGEWKHENLNILLKLSDLSRVLLTFKRNLTTNSLINYI